MKHLYTSQAIPARSREKRRQANVIFAALAGCAFAAQFARATSYTTVNSANSDWSNSAIWTPIGVPGSSDSATITNSSISVEQQTYVNQLTLSQTSSQLYIEGTGGDVALDVAGSITNNGTIWLQSSGAAFYETLSFGGTLTNNGTLNLSGNYDGGSREVEGTTVNNYAIYDTSSDTNLLGSITNNNLYWRESGGKTTLGAGSVFNQSAWQLVIDPTSTFEVDGGTFNYNGGTVAGTITMTSGFIDSFGTAPALSIPISNGHAAVFNFVDSGRLSTDLPTNTTINLQPGRIIPGGEARSVTLTVPQTFTNNGTINVDTTDGAYAGQIWAGDGTGTITNNGTITFNSNVAGSWREIAGNVVNNYAIYDNGKDTYLYGNVTNNNLYDRGSGGTTYLEAGCVFNQNAWQLVVDPNSSFEVEGATFNYNGGTVSGTITMTYGFIDSYGYGSALNIPISNGHGAVFNFLSSGYLYSDLPTNTTINLQAGAVQQSVTLYAPQTFTNNGTINVNTSDGTYAGQIWAGDGTGTITNNGTIAFNSPGPGNWREFAGNVVNNHIIYDNGQDTYLYGSVTNNNLYQRGPGGTTYLEAGNSFNQNGNQLVISSSGGFEVDGGSFNYNGGTVSGTVRMTYGYSGGTALDPVLTTNVSNGAGAGFIFNYHGYLNTSLAANTKVDVVGNSTAGNTTLFVQGGHTNNGTISLYSIDSNYTSVLAVVNPNDGTYTGTYNIGIAGNLVATDPALVGGSRAVYGNLANKGNIIANTSMDVYGYIDDQVTGSVSIAPDRTITIHGSNDFTMDGGTLNIGAGGSLLYPDGGSIKFVHGNLNASSPVTIANLPELAPGDSITASGTGGSVTIANGGATLIGGSIIAGGGGNVISAGGDIVSAGGGNIVSAGGGNVIGVNGSSLISQDGSGLISQDGSGLIATNNSNLISQDGSGLIQNGSNAKLGGVTWKGSSGFAGVATTSDMPATANIIADDSYISLSNSYASADGWGVLRNNGLLTGNGTFTASTFDIDSTSTVCASGGALHMVGPINQYSSGTLTTANWQIKSNSTLDTPSIGAITINQANVTLDGPGSVWTNIDGLANNQGSFTITNGRNFTTAGSFTNSGALTAGPGSTFTSTTSFTQSTGSSTFDTLANTGSFNHTGGILAAYKIVNSGSFTASTSSLGTVTGTGSLTILPNATATATSISQNALTVNGKLQLNPNSSASVVNSLTLDPAASLDLSNNSLIVNYSGTNSPAASIRAWLASGFNDGAWTGTGITSSTAAADTSFHTALAYAEASQLGLANGGSFAGQTIPGEAVIVKYTYYGDNDLDGKVTLNDFSIFVDGFNGLGTGWVYGDYDYNGTVDVNDFAMFVDAYKNQGSQLSSLNAAILSDPSLSAAQKNAMLSVVPEPSSVMVFAALLAGSLQRRRHLLH